MLCAHKFKTLTKTFIRKSTRYTSTQNMPQTKVILLTGASAGIGKESALTLIKRGHIVYGAARRVENMKEIVQAGGHAIALDVTKETDIVQAVKRILEEQGRIDVLINNAGWGSVGAIEDVSMEEARSQFDVNLFGLARLTKEVLPHMRKEGKGTIVNVSSAGAKTYMPFFQSEFFDMATQPASSGTSTASPYEAKVKRFIEANRVSSKSASHPSVIASVIVKASESANPKRRYVAGAFAKQLIFMRSWFGDAVFDSIMLSAFK